MHVVMFSMRRAFHLTADVGLRLAARFGLTPARFDLMSALQLSCSRDGVRWARQISLRELVGTSAANISRLLTKLEKLGLVRRRRDANQRSHGVRLTTAGRERLKRAMKSLVCEGVAHDAVTAFLPPYAGETELETKTRIAQALAQLAESLGEIRTSLEDRARLFYSTYLPRRKPDINSFAG
jgi:DNA-binding MarR family transcriptional regulator